METNVRQMTNPLGVKTFRVLWIGQAVSQIGDQFFTVALAWYILEVTGSAFYLGSLQAVSAVWSVLFLLIGGIMADRFHPLRVMLLSDIIRAIVVGFVALTVLRGHFDLPLLYACMAIVGAAGATFHPAERSILPHLVSSEQIQVANGLIEVTRHSIVVLIPVLAGVMVAKVGTGTAMLVDFATYGVSVFSLVLIPAVRRQGSPASIKEVAQPKLVLGNIRRLSDGAPILTLAILAGCMSVVVGSAQVLLPVIARERLTLGPSGLGMILAFFGTSSIVGAILAGLVGSKGKLVWWLSFGTALSGLALLTLSTALNLWQIIIAVVTLGIAMMLVDVTLISSLQRNLPPSYLGRVLGGFMAVSVSIQAATMALAGYLTEAWGSTLFLSRVAFAIIGAATIAVGVALTHKNPGGKPVAKSPKFGDSQSS